MLQVLTEYQIFKGLVLGDKSPGFYMGAFFFTLLALYVSLWSHSRKRNPASPNTPAQFSLLFLVWDNFKRIVVNLIVMFLFYRFTPAMSMTLAVGIGFFLSFGVDKAIQYLKSRYNFLNMNRDNFPSKPQL